MATSAYDSLESRRMDAKMHGASLQTSTGVPRTPKRQRIPSEIPCPNAPKKSRRLTQGLPACLATEAEEGMQVATPFWTKGRPLESFEFGDPDFKPDSFSMPVFPKKISELPLLGSIQAGCKSYLDPMSPMPKTVFTKRYGYSSTFGSDHTNPRKRVRVQTQRQLKFPPGSPLPARLELPALTESFPTSFSGASGLA